MLVSNPLLIVGFLIGILFLWYLFRHPEVALALFAFSYVLEGGDMLPAPLDLTLILLVVTCLGLILPMFLGKRMHFKFGVSDFFLLGFVVILLGGTFPNLEEGSIKAFRFIAIVFLPYILARVIFQDQHIVQRFLLVLLVASSVIGMFVTVTSLFLPNIYSTLFLVTDEASGRLSFFNANPVPTATFFMVGWLIAGMGALSPLFPRWHLFGKSLCAIVIPFLLYATLLCGTRGPVIAGMSALGLYYLTVLIRRPTKGLAIALIIIFFTGAILSYSPIVENIPNINYYRILLTEGGGLSVQKRLTAQSQAIEFFSEHPMLGMGTNGFTAAGVGYPHNLFLEVAVENGLLGLTFLLAFLATIVGRVFSTLRVLRRLEAKTRYICITVILVTLALLIEKQLSFDLTMHKDLFIFMGILINFPDMLRNTSPA